jgi:hypothetical protein
MYQIYALTVENNLKRADIRIFCDNDNRWVARQAGGFADLTKYTADHISTMI